MLHLSRKLLNSTSEKTQYTSELNLILMTRGIDPAGVGSELDVNLAEIAEAPDKKTLRSKVRTAFGTTLGLLALSGTAACAQEAPKPALVASNTAAAPAKTTPASSEEVKTDDEWDLGFGEELTQKTVEAEATGEELARKTAEAEALQKLVDIGEAPTN